METPELRQGALPRQLPAGPDPPAAAARRRGHREGRALPRDAARIPRERGRPAADRARVEDPRRGRRRAQADRRDGDEGRRDLRRARALAGLLQPRAVDDRDLARRARRAGLRAPVDRRRRAAADVRHRRAEARVAAARRAHGHLRVPAHRARRGLGSRARRDERRAGRGRLQAQRPEAVGDQRRDRRRRRRDGARAEVRGPSRRHQRVHPALRHAGREGPAPQRVHGPEGDRELGHRAQGRLRRQPSS